jgi:hypothetical protein
MKIQILKDICFFLEQINQFEQTRTDYERRLAGQKLKTVYCYFGANETSIKNILKNGFKATFGSQPVTLWYFISNYKHHRSHNDTNKK